jgi:diaminohydroxyphosphoribosylaminopyrimidine deaminase/5-amino-6-(5-phosphoribosylamino)uracil reductase
MKTNHNNYLNLAFNLARINLGKTKSNPSVGCVIVKKDSVISSGHTSTDGRPHAEYNALNKKINFSGSSLYVTMEPCSHYGFTPPCTNIINNKKIKKVFFSFYDVDNRSAKKSKIILKKKNINVIKKNNNTYDNFYQSFFINKLKNLPLVDAKIAISKDFFTINRKKKWITNFLSRQRVHLIRSEYDSIISTSKSINKDNSLLNCRLNGFNTNKPDLIIIDLNLKIKTNLDLFDLSRKRKILIITRFSKSKKISLLKAKGVKFIKIDSLNSNNDFVFLLKILKKKGFNRILVESGLKFLNVVLKNRIISNLYVFKSSIKLGNNGLNNTSINFIKKFKKLERIKVNLGGDQMYKVKIQ